MKLLAVALVLSVAAAGCVDDRAHVAGTVRLTGGISACADEDGDPAHATITIFNAGDEQVLSEYIACDDGSFVEPLDPGAYQVVLSSVSRDPVFGLDWTEDTRYFDVVIDSTDVVLGTITLSID